jgi:hypothetical protein
MVIAAFVVSLFALAAAAGAAWYARQQSVQAGRQAASAEAQVALTARQVTLLEREAEWNTALAARALTDRDDARPISLWVRRVARAEDSDLSPWIVTTGVRHGEFRLTYQGPETARDVRLQAAEGLILDVLSGPSINIPRLLRKGEGVLFSAQALPSAETDEITVHWEVGTELRQRRHWSTMLP